MLILSCWRIIMRNNNNKYPTRHCHEEEEPNCAVRRASDDGMICVKVVVDSYQIKFSQASDGVEVSKLTSLSQRFC